MILDTVFVCFFFVFFFFIFFWFDENSKDFICDWYYLVNKIGIPQLRERRNWFIGNLGFDFEAFFWVSGTKAFPVEHPSYQVWCFPYGHVWALAATPCYQILSFLCSGCDITWSYTEFPLLWASGCHTSLSNTNSLCSGCDSTWSNTEFPLFDTKYVVFSAPLFLYTGKIVDPDQDERKVMLSCRFCSSVNYDSNVCSTTILHSKQS